MSDFIDLPETSDQQRTVPIGVHRMTIVKMEKALDKKNQPILDNRNYPAIRMVFQTASGEQIDSLFHYSTKPANDPTRNDPTMYCRSEFRLTNLKRALGYGNEPVKADAIKGKWFYGMVYGERWVYEENKKQVVLKDPNDPKSTIIFNRLGSIFWPDNEQRPVKDGDPQNAASKGVPSGDFLKDKPVKKADVDKFLEKSGEKKAAPSGGSQKYSDDFSGSDEAEQPAQSGGTATATQQQVAGDFPEQPNSNDADW